MVHIANTRQKQKYKGKQALALGFSLVLSLVLSPACTLAAPAAKGMVTKVAVAKTPQFQALSFNPYQPGMLYPIRIGLATKTPLVRFAIWSQGTIFIDGQPAYPLKPQMMYSVTPGRITELATGQVYHWPLDKRITITSVDYRFWSTRGWYRGSLEILAKNGCLNAIDVLDIEEYLLGVVPSEMPASWQLEALKCQAVAARSYAYAHMGKGSKWQTEGFDLVPDVRDQAYKGMAAEAPRAYMAVKATTGMVLKDSGKVKAGFYRAWVGDDDNSNFNIRKKLIDKSHLEKITGVKDIAGVSVKQYDANLNAVSVQVMGTKQTREVDGKILARWLNFDTAGILDIREDGSHWLFTYRGPGNGARGLSQNGANKLAQNGWRFEQILQQYYQDNDGRLRLDLLDRHKFTMPIYMPAARNTKPAAMPPQPVKGPLIEMEKRSTTTDDIATGESEKSTGNSGNNKTTGEKDPWQNY